MFFTAKELAGFAGMPANERNVRILLQKVATADQKREREYREEGSRGKKPTEYHIDCLPEETRIALLKQYAKEQAESESIKAESVETPSSEELWHEYDSASERQKKRASEAHQLCVQVQVYHDNGMAITKALHAVAAESETTYSRLHRYFYTSPGLIKNHIPRNDWLASLLDHRGGSRFTANIPQEAWELFKADYLRPEMKSGTFSECYRRLQRVANQRGWELPGSDAFRSRVKREVPKELVVLMRFGRAAFHKAMLPAQRRTRKGLHAMQIVAGDGHVARVFCKTQDGNVFRPTIWAFQDVYSSMIVGYSVDVSENTEMLGIALHRMIDTYGIPPLYILDRGSVALSEAITGGLSRPKRNGSGKLVHKKFDTQEVEGVIKAMGSEVNWIRSIEDDVGRSGNSRANPIERLWHSKGGIGQFEREPAFARAYTGASIDDKPSNYSSDNAIPIETFLSMLDAWVYEWNHREGRQTEIAKGQGLSFMQVFQHSYEQSEIAKPTKAQLSLCLLRTRRAVKVHNGGIVELNAGNYSQHLTNRYQSQALYEYIGSKINLRFNPYDLTQYVLAFAEDGRFIGQIPLFEDVGVIDVSAARRSRLLGESELERAETIGAAMITKTIDEVAAAYAPQEHEKTDIGGIVPGITKVVPNLPKTIDGFGYVEKRKRAVGHDTPPENDYSIFNDESVISSLVKNFGK